MPADPAEMPVDGEEMPEEEPMDGEPEDVFAAEEEPVDGEPVDGEPVDGEPVDGEPVDPLAEPVEEEPVEEEPVEEEPVEEEPVEEEPVEEEPVEEEPIDEEPVDAMAPMGDGETAPDPDPEVLKMLGYDIVQGVDYLAAPVRLQSAHTPHFISTVLKCDILKTRDLMQVLSVQDVAMSVVENAEECAEECDTDPGCNMAAYYVADFPAGFVRTPPL